MVTFKKKFSFEQLCLHKHLVNKTSQHLSADICPEPQDLWKTTDKLVTENDEHLQVKLSYVL